MKLLLLLSLALVGLTLMDVAQAVLCRVCDPECRRVSCPDRLPTPGVQSIGRNDTVEKREIEASARKQGFDSEMIDRYDAIRSKCKCLWHGNCNRMYGEKYYKVDDCSEEEEYVHCDASGCRVVRDGQCKCEYGRCERCYTNGCKLTTNCKGVDPLIVPISEGELTDSNGCRKASFIRPLCPDDSQDEPLEEKCTCDNENCKICGRYNCKEVSNCDRIAMCKCDLINDSFLRCYGFKHGQHHCRKLSKCSGIMSKSKASNDVDGQSCDTSETPDIIDTSTFEPAETSIIPRKVETTVATTSTMSPLPTTPEKNPNDNKSAAIEGEESGVSTAKIVAFSIGGIIIAVLAGAVIFLLIKKRRNEDGSEAMGEETTRKEAANAEISSERIV